MVQVKTERGIYRFKLDDVLKENHITKNQLIVDTNTDFKVIQRIEQGAAQKLDTLVFARLCDYLDCRLEDIIEYIPNVKE